MGLRSALDFPPYGSEKKAGGCSENAAFVN